MEKGRIPELIARRIALAAMLCSCALGAPALLAPGVAAASTIVIKGQVVSGSQPAAGVLVTLAQGSTALSSSLTSSQGEFILDAPGPGTYTVLGGGSCGEQPEKQVTVVEGEAPEAVALVYPSGDSPFGSCATAPTPSPGPGGGSAGSPSSGSSGASSKPTSTQGGGAKHAGKHARPHHKRKKKHRRRGKRRSHVRKRGRR